MFKKKAQAAMEFLMTYGWAILVVLVAIGALAYFGVLSPDRFLPERCTGPAGLDCLDKAAITAGAGQTGSIEFVLKNNQGYNIVVLDHTDTSVAVGTYDVATTDDCQTGVTDASGGGEDGGFFLDVEQSDGSWGGAAAVPDGGTTVANNRKLRILTYCQDDISVGRFKTDFTFYYRNEQTNIVHPSTVGITGSAS